MDRLTSMRVFTKVVELAGFAAAGRALGLSTTMVGKHVAALEQRLGVSLLTRTTRRVVPTEAGLRYQAGDVVNHGGEEWEALADSRGRPPGAAAGAGYWQATGATGAEAPRGLRIRARYCVRGLTFSSPSIA